MSDAIAPESGDQAPLEIVIATANSYKRSEIVAILGREAGLFLNLIERPDGIGDVEETGESLVENARLKAAAITLATNKMSVADDTGLFVLALDGAPGVHSARYAGEDATDQDNVAKLLAAMADITDRRAIFQTVALAMTPDGEEHYATGEVRGTIAIAARGDHGFGYDPVFIADEVPERTFAELEIDEKHALSHRGRAFRALGAMIAKQQLAGISRGDSSRTH